MGKNKFRFTPELLAQEFGNNNMRLFRSFQPDRFPLDFQYHYAINLLDPGLNLKTIADRLNQIIDNAS